MQKKRPQPNSKRGESQVISLSPAECTSDSSARAQAEESLRLTSQRLELIARMTGTLVGSQPLPEIAQQLADQVRVCFGVDACVIRLLEHEELVLLGASGVPTGQLAERLPVFGIGQQLLKTRRPLTIDNVLTDKITKKLAKPNPSAYGFMSYAGVPLLTEEPAIGILGMFTKQPRCFTAVEIEQLQIVANHIAVILSNERLFRQIRAQQDKLEQEIAERVRAEQDRERLDAQLREAQKLEAVGRFGRGVAHDFNNLMATIVGLASNLKSKRRPDDPDYAKLADIQGAAETAADLAHQLLQFAKGEKVRLYLLSFADVVNSTLVLVRPIVPQNVALRCELAADLGQIKCDQTQIQQAILNLCRNALEAMPDGGQLAISAANATLPAPLRDAHPPLAAGEYVRLSVEDTGCGLDAETVQRIFDPFFTTKARGHGLGLAVAYGVVASHGGAISVTSQPARGSTFRIWLPRAVSR